MLPSALNPLNVLATISENAAITSKVKIHAKSENNFLPVFPIYFSIRNPIDFPSFFTDAYIAPKSCTAPKKIPPTRSHNNTGNQPKAAAIIGPVTGPAPAIDEN